MRMVQTAVNKFLHKKFLLMGLILFLLSSCISVPSKAQNDGTKLLLPAVIVQKDGEKWGFIDETGNFVISPEYDAVRDFSSKGVAIAAGGIAKDGTYSVWFLDTAGKKILGPYQAYLPRFSDGYAVFTETGKGGKVVDEAGKLIFASKYPLLDYSEGLLRFSVSNTTGNTLYGYMNLKGKVVIPAIYTYTEAFKDGKAVVAKAGGNYSVIDTQGNVLESSKGYPSFPVLTDGMIAFYDKASEKYGYKREDGTIAIRAGFSEAGSFRDGYAVVTVETDEYTSRYGLIDKSGKYVLLPEYSGIQPLGQGLYAADKGLQPESPDSEFISFYPYLPKAIFNNQGVKLTDYQFYEVHEFQGEYACVCDGPATFFIGKDGKAAESLPKFQGAGEMTFLDKGGLIKAVMDGKLMYVRPDGSILWEQAESYSLDGSLKILKRKFRRDIHTFVAYPEISGLPDTQMQEAINSKLKELFLNGYTSAPSKEEMEYPEDSHVGFSIDKNRDVLLVEKWGYHYPVGAAHGMPEREYCHVDLKTGKFYSLKDLFKSGARYTERLTAAVRRQMSLNLKINPFFDYYYYFTETPEVEADHSFILGKDSLILYYYPYELSSYASGFPEFEIPYGQLTDLLDTKGAFWNSFDKVMINQKVQLVTHVEPTAVTAIEALMKSYEVSLVEAINTNQFTKVEGYLVKGSSLYNSQKLLVQNLYKKGTKERLNKYEIYAVGYDDGKKEFKVFVLEDIAVKYAGKNYVNKSYSWCYTVVRDTKTGKFLLSRIEKW